MSLIRWYKFDGDITDSVHGVVAESKGDVNFVDGKFGQGWAANDSNEVIVHDSEEICEELNFSWSCWVNLSNTVGSRQDIITKGEDVSRTKATLDQFGGRIRFIVFRGLGGSYIQVSYPSTLLLDGSYHHVVATLSSNKASLYIDGNQVSSIDHTVINWVSGLPVRIANRGQISTFQGIDDVRIYDHALSDKEVKELAKAKVLHYKFDEQDLTTNIIKDCSGFGNDGTVAVATAPTWSEDSPVGRGSMRFELTTNITTGQLFYDVVQAHTVSAWVKLDLQSRSGGHSLLNFHSGYTLRNSSGRTESLMYMNAGTNDHYVYGDTLPDNEWVHVTWVYDKSSSRCQVYYDGVLNASSTNFGDNDVPSGFKATTILGSNFVGNIADVRIYATALTPEDILELYQTRASVDNGGNLFVQEIDEITDTSKEVDSRGIARFKEFNEVGRPVRYIRDWLNGSTANTSNHWLEIQAIDPSGTNVALGKSSPSERITDGNTASLHYDGGRGHMSVTVDLGSAHNITYLHIWHYWSGGRTYHDTKTEVSTDGTNWVTVFDSAVEGEYAETSEGKKILLYPDKASIGSDGDIYTNEIMET